MPLNTATAVLQPYRERRDADDREVSAIRLIQALLRTPDLLPTHRREMLRLALYKYTEARAGKHGLRYRTRGVMDTTRPSPVEHEHVRSRLSLLGDLEAGGADLAPLVLGTATACLVTREEHALLRAVPKEADGWARYAEAGLEIVDHATGDVVDPSDLAAMAPVADLARDLTFVAGGPARICLLLACRLMDDTTSGGWAASAAGRDSMSIAGRWIAGRLSPLAEQGDGSAATSEVAAALALASRIFSAPVLNRAAALWRQASLTSGPDRRALAADLARAASDDWVGTATSPAAPLALAAIAAAHQRSVPLFDDFMRQAAGGAYWRGVPASDAESTVGALVRRYEDPVLALALTVYVKRLRNALPEPPPIEVVRWVGSRCAAEAVPAQRR